MTGVRRLTEFRAELLHLDTKLRPVAGPERGQSALVVHAGPCEVAPEGWRRFRSAARRHRRRDRLGGGGGRPRDGWRWSFDRRAEERVQRASEVGAHYDTVAVGGDHTLQF